MMPSYGPRTTDQERWAIVSYVRQVLQAGGAQQSAAVAAPDSAAAPADTSGAGER
jgi:mono/diheme cytochrome c family protein